jgi:hypothetical protein
MIEVLLTVVAGLVGIVLWWLNNKQSRQKQQRLEHWTRLRDEYASAVAAHDMARAGDVMRRMLILEAEMGSPPRQPDAR